MLFKVFSLACSRIRMSSWRVGEWHNSFLSSRCNLLWPPKIHPCKIGLHFSGLNLELGIFWGRSPVPRVLVVIDALPDIFLHSQAGLLDVGYHQIHLNRCDIPLDPRKLCLIPHVLHEDDRPHNFCWPLTRRTPFQ